MVQPPKPLSDVWPKRACLVLASLVMAIMLLPLIGWILQSGSLIRLRSDVEPIKGNTVLAAFLIGALLVMIEAGYRRAAWLGVLPALIAGLTLVQDFTSIRTGIDTLLFVPSPDLPVEFSGRMTTPIAASLLLAGLLITSLAFSRIGQRHTLLFALVASAVLSVGAATLLGYALNLSFVYQWGSDSATSPFAAWTVSLIGVALLARAWREHTLNDAGAPMWLPLPVVVGSATLTVILYLGLEEQEIKRLYETTDRNTVDIVKAFNDEISHQADEIERFAQGWSDATKNAVVRDYEAGSLLKENPSGQVVMLVDNEVTHLTREIYPEEGNEYLAGFSHGGNPTRAAAIARSLAPPRRAAVSGTIDIMPESPGYAIYAPIERDGEVWGFLAVDFTYNRVIRSLLQSNETLLNNYLIYISISGRPIYDNTAGRPIDDKVLHERGGIGFSTEIRDRLIRFNLVLTEEAFTSERRNLPELAGVAGLIVTLLLGVSVHLARTANTLLRTAELSNRRLVAENEERRRVEAMLKVSDERLRLALDSTQIGIFEWSLPSNQLYYSPGLWTMLDYAPGEIANTPGAWTALIHEDDLPGYREDVERQLAGDETFIAPEYRLRTGKGEWRWL